MQVQLHLLTWLQFRGVCHQFFLRPPTFESWEDGKFISGADAYTPTSPLNLTTKSPPTPSELFFLVFSTGQLSQNIGVYCSLLSHTTAATTYV